MLGGGVGVFGAFGFRGEFGVWIKAFLGFCSIWIQLGVLESRFTVKSLATCNYCWVLGY